MYPQKCLNNIITTGLCIYSFLVLVSGMKAWKQKLISIEDCDIPESSYDRPNFVTHNWTVVKVNGENVITANFTIEKPTPSVFVNLRGFSMPEKKIDYNITRQNCKNPIADLFVKKLRLIYDRNNCSAQPRSYHVPRVSMKDFSKFYKFIVSGYKLFLFELELANEKGVMICIGVTVDFTK